MRALFVVFFIKDFGYEDGPGDIPPFMPPAIITPKNGGRPAGGKTQKRGQQPSADLLEALRRLLEALGGEDYSDDENWKVKVKVECRNDGGGGAEAADREEEKGEEKKGKEPPELKQKQNCSAAAPAADTETVSAADTVSGFVAEGDSVVSAAGAAVVTLVGNTCDGWETGGGGEEDNAGDDFELAAAALENSCLQRVCRQYMFGVDWRFVSAHRHFYFALLRLLQDTLQPTKPSSCRRRREGEEEKEKVEATVATPNQKAQRPLAARSLLPSSADCPGLVELLGSLCVALEDLVACPPRLLESISQPPTRLRQPAPPGALYPHLLPPSPASPLPFMLQQKLHQPLLSHHAPSPYPTTLGQETQAAPKLTPASTMVAAIGLYPPQSAGFPTTLPMVGPTGAAATPPTVITQLTIPSPLGGTLSPPPDTTAIPPAFLHQQGPPHPVVAAQAQQGAPLNSSDVQGGITTTPNYVSSLAPFIPIPPPLPAFGAMATGEGVSSLSPANATTPAGQQGTIPLPLAPVHGAGAPSKTQVLGGGGTKTPQPAAATLMLLAAAVSSSSTPAHPPLSPPALPAFSKIDMKLEERRQRFRVITFDQEKREYEQGVALTVLTQSVLALAKSAAASASTDPAEYGKSTATRNTTSPLGKKSRSAQAGNPRNADTVLVIAGAESGGSGGGGTDVTGSLHGADGSRMETEATVAAAAMAENIPSEEELYLEVMEDLKFGTMNMEPSKEEAAGSVVGSGGVGSGGGDNGGDGGVGSGSGSSSGGSGSSGGGGGSGGGGDSGNGGGESSL